MLADGIASLVPLGGSLIVDVAGLITPGEHGHGGLARLLAQRCTKPILLLERAGSSTVSTWGRSALPLRDRSSDDGGASVGQRTARPTAVEEGRMRASVGDRMIGHFVGMISLDDLLIDLAGDLTSLIRPLNAEIRRPRRDSPSRPSR